MTFLDTDVLVDCLRGVPAARDWLQAHASEVFQVHGVVAMELVMGARDSAELQRVQKFLTVFEVVWPDAMEFTQAYRLLATHRLACGIGIPDCLIAASVLRRSARLYSFNIKHFRVIPGLAAEEPYAR